MAEAEVLVNVGLVQAGMGNRQGASECFEQALRLGEAVGDAQIRAGALTNLGAMWMGQEDPERAVTCLRAALRLHRAPRDRRGEGYAWGILAQVYRDAAKPRGAKRLFMWALDAHAAAGNLEGERSTLLELADLLVDNGELAEAEQRLDQVRNLALKYQHPEWFVASDELDDPEAP